MPWSFSQRSEMSARIRDKETGALADDFWRYSASLYGRPGVREKCLRLQDEAGADINLLLFCCWAGLRAGRALNREDIQGLLEATGDWQEGAIDPIRGLRRELKGLTGLTAGSGFVYDAIKRCELDAEKVKQRLLISAAGSLAIMDTAAPHAGETALANMETCFALQDIGKGDWVGTALAAIHAAATMLTTEVA